MNMEKVFLTPPIILKDVDNYHPESLIEELGGKEFADIVLEEKKGSKKYISVKSALIDTDQIEEGLTGKDLSNAIKSIVNTIISQHDKGSCLVLKDKKRRIAEKHAEMNADLYALVPQHFDTTDREAASTWVSSWQIKANRAADYVGDGLKVIHTTTSFQSVGEDLDTEQKISDYYNELLDEKAIPFDKARDTRIAQFMIEKAAIEAE